MSQLRGIFTCAVILALGGLAAPAEAVARLAAAPDGTSILTGDRIDEAPRIDGVLDDAAWSGPALPLGDWLTYNPVNGEHLEQTTEVWVAYDETSFYFAFRCRDPEPEQVRASLSRRDQLWNDDWVGLSLDPFGNGQSAHDLFVNANGVQGDILTTPSAGESLAPDWVWDSAGRRTPEGYEAELRVPFRSIRMASGDEVSLGILFWRRVSRLGMSASWPQIVPGRSALESHAQLALRDVRRPLTLDVIPSVTYSRDAVRATPAGFGAAESDAQIGASAKWGVTSNLTLDATVNPDFSQVESDAFQVEVNQRFPTFYSEKRPFFMEGMGTFSLAGSGGDSTMMTAVHTRRIVDPIWGAKATGTAGRLTYATLHALDEAPGHAIAGEENEFLGQRKLYNVGRLVYGLRNSDYVGVLLTDAQLASGHNRVAAADTSLRFGNHSVTATAMGSDSRTPDGATRQSGLAAQTFYVYDTKRWVAAAQAEHYDRDFEMDTAFLRRTGVTTSWGYTSLNFYPDAKKTTWLKRIAPFVFVRYGRDHVQGAKESLLLPGIRIYFTRQGWFRVDGGVGHDPWAGEAFPVKTLRLMGQAQFTRWLNVSARTSISRAVYYDETDPFVGDERTVNAEVTLQPREGLNLRGSLSRVTFDRPDGGERVFTVNVVNAHVSYQFDRQLAIRGIVQWDSSERRVLTDLLGSWELRPGTVAYVGYGSLVERQEWDGLDWQKGVGPYQTSRRGLFFKISYIHGF